MLEREYPKSAANSVWIEYLNTADDVKNMRGGGHPKKINYLINLTNVLLMDVLGDAMKLCTLALE